MRALVVGAGIGGLSAALALRRAGLEVAVFERAPRIEPVGAGISLAPNALAGLDRLGVGEAVRARGGTGVNRVVLTWRGTVLSEAPWLGASLLRADVLDILLASLGGEVALGARLTGFAQDAAGVTATFEDGREERGDLLVGADGLRSEVRAGLAGRAEPVYRGTTVFRAVARFAHPALANNTETWGTGRRFGLQALAEGRTYWFATTNAAEPTPIPPGERRRVVSARFRGWHEPIEAAIAATDEEAIVQSDVYDRPPLPRWSEGRVTLLGDAAHPMTPDMAQGGAQAIEDAVALEECLRGATDVPAALAAYEARRREAANAVVLQARRVHRMSQLDNPLACAARNVAVRRLPRPLQRAIGVRRG